MGRHQRAETSGLVSFVLCAGVAAVAISLYLDYAPAIWQVTQRLFSVCGGIVAGCGVISFIIGYSRHSASLTLQRGWLVPLRRILEILSLSAVYAATIFLSVFALLGIMNGVMGLMFMDYIATVCGAIAGVVGYITFVQAELLDSKTIASLLPLFVISGVATAGLTSDDPNWYHNNFSQLGDRTTFAARMFNSTLMLAGLCIIIISYFAISELITTYRMHRDWQDERRNSDSEYIPHFKIRIVCLAILLTLSGIAFIGIGMFRYSPHPILHNVFARGLPGLIAVQLLALPWLAPQLSKATFVISDAAILFCAAAGYNWMQGGDTLTNVEALVGMLYLGWFIVFSRQIAAIEADRVQAQLLHSQMKSSTQDDKEAATIKATQASAELLSTALAQDDEQAQLASRLSARK